MRIENSKAQLDDDPICKSNICFCLFLFNWVSRKYLKTGPRPPRIRQHHHSSDKVPGLFQVIQEAMVQWWFFYPPRMGIEVIEARKMMGSPE